VGVTNSLLLISLFIYYLFMRDAIYGARGKFLGYKYDYKGDVFYAPVSGVDEVEVELASK
jgi:hypothetical protein